MGFNGITNSVSYSGEGDGSCSISKMSSAAKTRKTLVCATSISVIASGTTDNKGTCQHRGRAAMPRLLDHISVGMGDNTNIYHRKTNRNEKGTVIHLWPLLPAMRTKHIHNQHFLEKNAKGGCLGQK